MPVLPNYFERHEERLISVFLTNKLIQNQLTSLGLISQLLLCRAFRIQNKNNITAPNPYRGHALLNCPSHKLNTNTSSLTPPSLL